jgi:hypothetical protein
MNNEIERPTTTNKKVRIHFMLLVSPVNGIKVYITFRGQDLLKSTGNVNVPRP